jgi:hypothetical protein
LSEEDFVLTTTDEETALFSYYLGVALKDTRLSVITPYETEWALFKRKSHDSLLGFANGPPEQTKLCRESLDVHDGTIKD